MWDTANGVADAIEGAVAGVVEDIGGAAPGWLLLAVALHLANQLARGRGWWSVIALSCPAGSWPRRRDAIGAWVAGAGIGGVLSARGGDAGRLVLLRPRVPDAGYPRLAGTIVAEGVGEAVLGIAFMALLLVGGSGSIPGAGAWSSAWMVPALVAVVAALVLFRSRFGRVRRLTAEVARGCSAVREPRAYARAVLPWQLASRLLRIASMACFLVAFGLPATPGTVGLVMLAQGGGRLLPLAPASVAATVAVVAAGMPSATGADVGTGAVAAFVVGTSTALTLVGVVLAIVIAVCMAGRRRIPAAHHLLRWRVARA
ncbi:MAG TPA: lysylphosphatidylglycerol synthase domain-containing protein [Thermoleophilaceae bacterium]